MVSQIQSEIIPFPTFVALPKNIGSNFVLTFPKISNTISFSNRGARTVSQVIPFKQDADFDAHNDHATSVFKSDLGALVAHLESLELERADVVREITDNYVIAKSKGMNVKAIRKILAERRREKGELEEEKAVIELYKSFLGM
jgi:uncharacterized protein (UPF0335 family)